MAAKPSFELNDVAALAMEHLDASGIIRAPMHGKVRDLLVEAGARVVKGQPIAIIEAMKMEHTLAAPFEGVVVEIAVARDAQIAQGGKIMAIEQADGRR